MQAASGVHSQPCTTSAVPDKPKNHSTISVGFCRLAYIRYVLQCVMLQLTFYSRLWTLPATLHCSSFMLCYGLCPKSVAVGKLVSNHQTCAPIRVLQKLRLVYTSELRLKALVWCNISRFVEVCNQSCNINSPEPILQFRQVPIVQCMP